MGDDVSGRVGEYLAQERTLTLATAAGGTPHAATLVYVNDGPALFVWVKQGSVTAEHISQNATVAFTVDTYSDDWRKTRGVQGLGEARRLEGDELAEAGARFGDKYPDLRPGASGAVTFYRIDPQELHYIDNSAGSGEPAPDEYRRESVM